MASKLEFPVEEQGYIVRGNKPNFNPTIFMIQRLSTVIHRDGHKKAVVKLYPNAEFSPIGVWDSVRQAWQVRL